jgi:hypothetical protein
MNCCTRGSEGDSKPFNELKWSESFYDTILPTESFNQDDGVPASNQRLSNAFIAIENADMKSTPGTFEHQTSVSAG